nr:MAG TPA: hypothetical protein [Caudoviricetes sp.]
MVQYVSRLDIAERAYSVRGKITDRRVAINKSACCRSVRSGW